MTEPRLSSLVCRVGDVLCALPLEHVEETMRPLPVAPIAGVPAFVRGLAVIRGIPIPVVDAASLLSGTPSVDPARFVTVKTGARHIALAIDAIVGVVDIPPGSVDELPPLFGNASSDAIAAIGELDANLLLVLSHTRLVPESLWAAIQSRDQST